MNDEIEAWQGTFSPLIDAVVATAVAAHDYPDYTNVQRSLQARNLLAKHLRTTPEGYRLVPVEPTEAMLQAEIDAVSDYWFDHEELGNRTEATKIGYKAMLSASQESVAIKEQLN